MFETCFSTAPSVTTISRAIAAFVRPCAISSSVSRSRGVSAPSSAPIAAAIAIGDQRADHLAIERSPAGGDALDRVDERPHLADALLEQVADPALSRRKQLTGVDRLDVRGEDQDRELRMAPARFQRRADPLVGERRRQPYVTDREIGLVAVDDPQQPGTVLGLRDDLDPVLGQQRHHPFAQQRLVLDHYYSHGSTAQTTVPSRATL